MVDGVVRPTLGMAQLELGVSAAREDRPGGLSYGVLSLKRDGLLEAWILLSGGADPGIAQDYAAYRAAHHVELRAYFDKYIIHSGGP